MLHIQRQEYFRHFSFVIFISFIIFVDILHLYVINLNIVNVRIFILFNFSDFEFVMLNNCINSNERMPFNPKKIKSQLRYIRLM